MSFRHQFICQMSMAPSFPISCEVFVVVVVVCINALLKGLSRPGGVRSGSPKPSPCPRGTYVGIGTSAFSSGPCFTLRHARGSVGFLQERCSVLEQRAQNMGLSRAGKTRGHRYWGFYGETVSVSSWTQKEGRPRCVCVCACGGRRQEISVR